MTDRQRNLYLDITKAIAIICVVIGHCIQFGSGNDWLKNDLYFDNGVFKVIYSFHMPIFMLVSGYLFAFSMTKRNWTETIVQKMKTLLVPIVLWALIPFLAFLLSAKSGGEEISPVFCCKRFITTVLGNFWFLWAVFWCSLVVILVNRFLKNSKIVYLLGAILTLFIPDVFGLHMYKFMYPYFILGYFCNADDWMTKYKRFYSSDVFFGICGVGYILLLTKYSYESYIYTSQYYILNGNPLHQLYIDVYRFLVGLTGSVFVLLLIAKLYKRIPAKIFALLLCIGENSLGIYIISDLVFHLVLNRITYSFSTINYITAIFETILVLAFSLAVTLSIKKSSVLNKLLLGGRK